MKNHHLNGNKRVLFSLCLSILLSRFLNFKRALFKICSGRNLGVINALGIFQLAWINKTVQFPAPNVTTMAVQLTAI